MLILKLGWRNLWRNYRRSIINISAIATAFVFLVLMQGMMSGMKQQLMENGTGMMLGHVQLHHPEYLPDRNIYDTLGGDGGFDEPDLKKIVDSDSSIEAASSRVQGFALLSTGENSAGAQLLGVLPSAEMRVTTLLAILHDGSNLSDEPSGELILGVGLAKELSADIGSEIAAMTQAADGSLGNELFHVKGTLRTGLSTLDRTLAVTHLQDLQDLMALNGNQVHEVAIHLTDPLLADRTTARLNAGATGKAIEARSWGDLSPQLRDYLRLFEGSYGIVIGFVAIFAALGILNTVMMAVFERKREIGTVISLGMTPGKVQLSIFMESLFLSLIGLALGLILALLLMQPLTTHGLDLSRWTGELSMLNTRMDPVIRFSWEWIWVGWSAIGLIIAAMLATALPARKVAKLDPVEARGAHAEV